MPLVGIGRIHPPPAAQDAPGRARSACSSGCSRSGVPVASMWGLEEFTRIWHPSGCLLSSPCDLGRSALCKQPRSESAYFSPACAMQQGSSAVPTSITSRIPFPHQHHKESTCRTCGPGPWVACSAAPTLQGAVSRNLWAQPWVATRHPQPGTQHQPPPRRPSRCLQPLRPVPGRGGVAISALQARHPNQPTQGWSQDLTLMGHLCCRSLRRGAVGRNL